MMLEWLIDKIAQLFGWAAGGLSLLITLMLSKPITAVTFFATIILAFLAVMAIVQRRKTSKRKFIEIK